MSFTGGIGSVGAFLEGLMCRCWMMVCGVASWLMCHLVLKIGVCFLCGIWSVGALLESLMCRCWNRFCGVAYWLMCQLIENLSFIPYIVKMFEAPSLCLQLMK